MALMEISKDLCATTRPRSCKSNDKSTENDRNDACGCSQKGVVYTYPEKTQAMAQTVMNMLQKRSKEQIGSG